MKERTNSMHFAFNFSLKKIKIGLFCL